jgi:hypothetical protein
LEKTWLFIVGKKEGRKTTTKIETFQSAHSSVHCIPAQHRQQAKNH